MIRFWVPEERDDVERDHLPRVRAAGDETTVLGERVETFLEQVAADVLEDDVDAAPSVSSITRSTTSSRRGG